MTNTISVIIPAYNEEKRLSKTLAAWDKFLQTRVIECKITEIIISNDGSTDSTLEIAGLFKKKLPVKIINIQPNQGKGNAVKTAVKDALGDLIFICDADAATPPKEINKLIAEIKYADIVIGSRITRGAITKMSVFRRLIGFCFHVLCLPILPKIKDASCGAKLFRKEAAQKIFKKQRIKRFAFDIEILWLAKKMGFKIKEVGISWQEVPGSKINIIKDSFEMFVSVLSLYNRKFK